MCEKTGEKNAQDITKPVSFFGIRHIQYVLLFSVLNLAYGIRSVLSVGVYAMITDDPPDKGIPTYPEWASKKNLMLSSFFWGYILFQVGAGQLAKNYGPKWFLGGAAFIGSVFCALVPIFGALFGYGGVMFCRMITGLTQGFMCPCIHNLISAWAPLQDRAKIGSFVYAGSPLGNVIALPITGWISSSSFGWPGVFYLFGALGVLWSCVWFLVGYDSPAKHKSIRPDERAYIEAGIQQTEDGESVPTPWKAILTSLPFWAILVAHCGQNYGFMTLFTEIPSYLYNGFGLDIASNATLSALPYLVMWLLSLVLSPIADYLIVHHISVGASRKLFNSIGLFVPALALTTLAFVRGNTSTLAVALLVIAVGFNSGVYSGYNVNHIDLSPIHAGTLMGITNTVSNVFSLISPLVVDLVKIITGYEETHQSLWTIVFCLASGMYLAVGLFYIIFGSGEVQHWNNISKKNEERKLKNCLTSEV